MVNISFIGILLVIALLGLSAGWFIQRFLLSAKFSELKEQCTLVEKNLEVVTLRCKEFEAESMRVQYESSEVVKKLNTKRELLAKRCQNLEKGNKKLHHKNTDIARKITQLYEVKQCEISQLHEKIEFAKSRGQVATTSTQEINFLKQTVQSLENLLINESAGYEEHVTELEKQLSKVQPIDVLQPAATITPDDLTEISGIGPKLSDFLREFGIVSFHQLANMDDKELARLSDELGDFGDRIDRDKWVEQARLLSGTYS